MINGCFACKHLFAFDTFAAYCDYPDELSLTEEGDIIICNNFEPIEDYVEENEMTREQAIDLLDNLIGMVEDNQNNDYDSALHMAIEALKQPEELRKEESDE